MRVVVVEGKLGGPFLFHADWLELPAVGDLIVEDRRESVEDDVVSMSVYYVLHRVFFRGGNLQVIVQGGRLP